MYCVYKDQINAKKTQKPENAYISRLLDIKKSCPEAEQPENTMLYSVYFSAFFERRASRII